MCGHPFHTSCPPSTPGFPKTPSTPALQSSFLTVCGLPEHVPSLNCHYRCVYSHSDRKWVLLIFVSPEPSMVPSLRSIIEYPLVT